MTVQEITRFSIYGYNAEMFKIDANVDVWLVNYHKINFESKSSVYIDSKICMSAEEAYEEARFWLEKKEEYNEKSEVL